MVLLAKTVVAQDLDNTAFASPAVAAEVSLWLLGSFSPQSEFRAVSAN